MGEPERERNRGVGRGLRVIGVDDVELHVRERGTGEPIVFVHGGLADYREWEGVIDALPGSYRTIAYSRRYNYPNHNPLRLGSHSARVEAEDLAALIRTLGLGPLHVAGSSYGALTALLVAIDHRELVRTLTIVEPPLIAWLPDLPGGELEYERIMKELIEPVATAFSAGDRERALRISMDFLAGPGFLDQLPPEAVEALRANLPEWEAIMTSRDGFPAVPRAAVEALGVPVLMISGARTYSFMKLTDAALAGLLPRGHRVIVEDATHEVCTEQPQACAAAIGEHLARN